MTIYKTYRGARLDLQFYKGKSVIDFPIEVFNDDNTDADLTIYNTLFFKIFDKKHGTVDLTLVEDDGGITLPSPTTNILYLNVSHVQTNLRTKKRWYECYGVREDDEEELICFGVAEFI